MRMSSKKTKTNLSKIGLQEFIHETLEGRWGIAKAKRHYQEFIMPFMSSESSLGNFYFIHLNLVIA
jgi:hypothetical protein